MERQGCSITALDGSSWYKESVEASGKRKQLEGTGQGLLLPCSQPAPRRPVHFARVHAGSAYIVCSFHHKCLPALANLAAMDRVQIRTRRALHCRRMCRVPADTVRLPFVIPNDAAMNRRPEGVLWEAGHTEGSVPPTWQLAHSTEPPVRLMLPHTLYFTAWHVAKCILVTRMT